MGNREKVVHISSFKVVQQLKDDPVYSVACRIVHSRRVKEMQQVISEVQGGANQPQAVLDSLGSKSWMLDLWAKVDVIPTSMVPMPLDKNIQQGSHFYDM